MKNHKKRYIFILIIIILLVLVCVFIIKKNKKNNSEQPKPTEEDISYEGVVSRVFYGALESSFSGMGTVASEENEICDYISIKYDDIKDKEKIEKIRGKEYKKDETIVELKKSNVVAETDGKVIEIRKQDEEIILVFLNYTKMYVTTFVPYELYLMMGYESEAYIRVDGKKISGKIQYIDYKYNETGVLVKVSCNEYIMPNRVVNVEIKLQKTDEIIFIPEIELQELGEYKFVYVIIDEENKVTEKVPVEVGRKLTIYENETPFVFYEIISELTPGQKLISVPYKKEDY